MSTGRFFSGLLVPSQARDSDDYDEVAQDPAPAGCLVLKLQPRGIGSSTGLLKGTTQRDLAQDIAKVIEAEASGRTFILDHAFGHYVARMVAYAFPEVLAGIVAASAAETYPLI